eukprot:TRINITY_DN10921_c0_g1_i1.p1 TRINITY_DN10921_c0_g1~~TRINITY_DN10921_c0_g1_i1.p1  ORF type:complete len:298 (-),score=73.56 TRINITY_DN10921_c0_g1_i1:106-999(-)
MALRFQGLVFLVFLCFAAITNVFLVSVWLSSSSTHPQESSAKMGLVKDERFLCIMILSSASELSRRQAMRDSWLRWIDSSVTYSFLVGAKDISSDDILSINNENERYKDIILVPSSPDDYHHLSEKVIGGITILEQKHTAKYLLKVDTDTFVQLPLLMKELAALSHHQRLYWGSFPATKWRKVQKTGKFAEINYDGCDTYPPYAVGGSYVLSWDLVGYLSRNSQDLFRFANEDAAMGIWLSALQPMHKDEPRMKAGQSAHQAQCLPNLLTLHKQTPESMARLYQGALLGNLCNRADE